ncbi:hypothetical protein VTN00DRAFT_3768 [Thermoascus crustaceus]|uniref:uncharacterized protein n=1 Tax=Thermoascus crustaceus TaxID=5088 RepID=UPI003743A19B
METRSPSPTPAGGAFASAHAAIDISPSRLSIYLAIAGMPEVIDLLSSTPPYPTDLAQRPSLTAQPKNNLSRAALASSVHFSSDDFEASPSLFIYDDDIASARPAKKQRLSPRLSSRSPSPARRKDTSTNTSAQPTATNDDSLFIFSDDGPGLPPTSYDKGKSTTTRTSGWNGEESDPIVFTSSAPERPSASGAGHIQQKATTVTKKTATITIDDDDIEEFSDPFAMPMPDGLDFDLPSSRAHNNAPRTTVTTATTSRTHLSDRTANLLARLEDQSKVGANGITTMTSKAGNTSRGKGNNKVADSDDLSDGLFAAPALRRPLKRSGKSTTTDASKEAKAREREAAKAQREREREEEKERKRKLKEEKAKEKQLAADIAEVNKLKVDKKNSTPEMIIDVASSLEETSVGNQVTEFMRNLGVEQTFFQSTIPNIVKWRRKVRANYNEEAGRWEPCPLYIRQEEHVLCLVSAQEFVDMATSEDTLELHVLKIKSAYPGCKPIYLIEGLAAWMRKNKNSRNRTYQAEIRRQFNDTNDNGGSNNQSRRKTNKRKPETTPPVDDDLIEDALLQLQVTHSCLIHHTAATPESAEWIKNFTEHVSTIPYRRERMEFNDSAFCMEVGQVKSGEDKADTFVKMLQEVNRVTAPIAYGIAAKYPSVLDLVRGMRVHGPGMLEDVKKSANRNGALTESRIGPAVSRRLYKVFMGLDPSSTDI